MSDIDTVHSKSSDKRLYQETFCVTREAQRQCAKWLAYCVEIGWKKDQLDALENLWWQQHDRFGVLTHNKEK